MASRRDSNNASLLIGVRVGYSTKTLKDLDSATIDGVSWGIKQRLPCMPQAESQGEPIAPVIRDIESNLSDSVMWPNPNVIGVLSMASNVLATQIRLASASTDLLRL